MRLSSPADPMNLIARTSLDQIASTAAALLLDVRVVLISVFDGELEIVVGSHGVGGVHADKPSSLCRDVATTRRPILVQDARRRLPGRMPDARGFDVAGYAGVPMSLRDPDRAGVFAAMTSVPRAWQGQDLHVLQALAAAAAAVLDMRAACDELVSSATPTSEDRFELATSKRDTLDLEPTPLHDRR